MATDQIRTGGVGFPDLLAQASTPREHQLALLLQLSLVAQRETSLDHLARLTASYLRDALDCDFTKVLDARVSARGLLVRGGAGWPPDVVGQREVPEGLDSQGGYTLRTGELVIVDDLRSETRFATAPLLAEHGARSGISIVVGSEPDVFGVLQADSCTPGRFSPADRHVLEAFADVLAAAVSQHDREEASDYFASIAAHELRAPLTLIIGHAMHLLRELDGEGVLTARHRDELGTIHSESLRLRHAVDLFLALGDAERRRPLVELATVELLDAVEDVVSIVSEHYPLGRIHVEPGDDGLGVVSDGRVVTRVVTALVDNAVKYTAPGTTVTVTIERTEGGAVVRVADACGGLSDDDLRRLFQRSFRGSHGSDGRSGLGLGLYIAQRLTEHIGGQLTAGNAADGCVFTLCLPARLENHD